MKRAHDTRGRTRRVLTLAGDALLVAAVLVATSPWTTGAYTFVAQRVLASRLGASRPAPAPARTRPDTVAPSAAETLAAGRADGGWDGWEREDARAWREAREGAPLGRLRIPRMRLDVVLVKGARDAQLRQGPGWVAGTAPPGPGGNCGVSGHRTTYLAPFRDIDRLEAGDAVRIETRWRVYTYRVTRRWFADRDDVGWLAPTPGPTLTLTSCHPPYSDRFRILVAARLESVKRR